MKHPILGILGGLGPASGAYFYDMIVSHTKAECDADHIDVILSGGASTPDRTGYILGNSEVNPLPCMLHDARMLCECGADFLAIPCNTAHYFYDSLAASLNIPIINIIRESVAYLKSMDIGTVGVLATDGTVKSGAYQRVCTEAEMTCILPEEADQAQVMSIIYGQIKAGKSVDLAAFDRVCRHLTDAGAQRLILGCTELSLIKRDASLDDGIYIDSLEVLACASIVRCGKKPAGFAASLIDFEERKECSYQNC